MSYRLPHERSGPITVEEFWSALSPAQRLLLAGAIANFFLFLLGYLLIGGDALQGHQAGGRYWVANKGDLSEVSKLTYHYSSLHVMSLLFSHPLALGMIILGRSRAKGARDEPAGD
ncbi:hypothetical protein [Sphingomonas glaciei]|uniref:Uncharacterized protein n=1 Tax=Sphingomonas glaciei TaxID=2938948 RepID=A0ABY5MZI5_9SPHN|nr:hypothetical protein [Sphingomonas glaciei]UUR09195.1 hypothetical protein M1K48_06175 [Sphingomonas glaciei]